MFVLDRDRDRDRVPIVSTIQRDLCKNGNRCKKEKPAHKLRCTRELRRHVDKLKCRTPLLDTCFLTTQRLRNAMLLVPLSCIWPTSAALESSHYSSTFPQRSRFTLIDFICHQVSTRSSSCINRCASTMARSIVSRLITTDGNNEPLLLFILSGSLMWLS